MHTPRARAWAIRATDKDPVNPGKVELAEVLQKRFGRQESNSRGRVSTLVDSWRSELAVFNTHPESHVTKVA